MPRFFIISLLFISVSAPCQELMTKISVPGKVKDIRGMMIGNDIFMSIELSSSNYPPTIKSYFIHPDGSQREIDLNAIADKLLIGGIRRGEDTYFYYLDEISKRAVIKCLVTDSSGKSKILAETVDVPGKIYGSYIEQGELIMLCALKKEFTLRLLRIHEARLVKETNFRLPFDLGQRKKENVSFFDTALPTTPREASAAIKIIKDKNLIWISVDEPVRDFDQNLTESSVFKTTVIKLELTTGKTSIKSFSETQWYPFTSALLNGNLYRLVLEPKGKSRVDLFNFESGKKVNTHYLLRGNEPGRDSTFARIGSYRKTEKDVKGAYIVKRVLGNLFIVDSLSATEQLFTVGYYGDQMVVAGIVDLSGVVGLIVTLSSFIVSEVAEGPYSCVYAYYRGSVDTEYTATYQTPFLRQVVDNYEYDLLVDKVRFDFRGYLHTNRVTFAIYQRNKSKTLEIVRFEKK